MKFIPIGAAILAMVTGSMFPDSPAKLEWFKTCGFYSILFTFLLWLSSLPLQRWTYQRMKKWGAGNGLPLLLAFVLTVAIFQVSPPSFRILADETNLSGVGMNMYNRRMITNPLESLPFAPGINDVVTDIVEKRPLFFPFLIFMTHSLTGFRPNNVFLLNFFLSAVLLFAFYKVLKPWFGRPLAMCGVLLLAAFPNMLLCMTSGGFDVANVAFVIFTFLAFQRFRLHRTARHAEFFVLLLVLLAQIRYESVLYLLVFLPVVFRLLPGEEYRRLSFRAVLIPLLLMPVFWQRLALYSSAGLEVAAGIAPFSLEWLPRNLAFAGRYFFSGKAANGMIPLLSAGAAAGLIVICVRILKNRELPSASAFVSGAILASSMVLHALITFSYYYGNVTDNGKQRLGLIFIPALVVLNLIFLDYFSARASKYRLPLGVLILGLFIYYWPVAGANLPSRGLLIWREFNQVKPWLEKKFPEKRVLLISHRSCLYLPFGWNAVTFEYANKNRAEIKKRQGEFCFQDILVEQCVRRSDGKIVDPEISAILAIDPGWSSELLHQEQLSEEYYLQISRLIP